MLTLSEINDIISKYYPQKDPDIFSLSKELGINIEVLYSDVFNDIVGNYLFNNSTCHGLLAYSKKKNNYTIYLNAILNRAESRKRFTIAHEIAHFVLHAPKTSDDVDPSEEYIYIEFAVARQASSKLDTYSVIEQEADNYAAELLMPKQLMIEEWTNNEIFRTSIEIAAKIFNVSKSAMAKRMQELDMFIK